MTSGLAPARPSLSGVTVLDLTRLLPGNYASLLLYGLGANVIKVEELGGDGTRLAPPFSSGGESGANIALNRGKSSIAINLKSAEGADLLARLVADAEVLLDSFRPGVLDRLGFSDVELARLNPTLVHVSLTAYGDDGPYRMLPSHDLNVQSLAGLVGLSVDDSGRPAMPGVQAGDLATGLQAALAVMSGLRAAAGDGRGYRAQVAMSDSALSLTTLAAGHLAAGTGSLPAARDMLTGALACYGVYECADHSWVAVGGLEPKFFTRMCELMGVPDLAALQYDLAAQDQLRTDLAAVFATRPRQEWLELLLAEDTCVTPVNNVAEAFADANAVQRGVIVAAARQDGEPAPVVRAVPWLPEAPGASAGPVGAETGQILRSLGVDPDRFDDLRRRGIVGGGP